MRKSTDLWIKDEVRVWLFQLDPEVHFVRWPFSAENRETAQTGCRRGVNSNQRYRFIELSDDSIMLEFATAGRIALIAYESRRNRPRGLAVSPFIRADRSDAHGPP